MIDRETITKIIEYGTYAPSGDNSQPWRFEVDETAGKISVFNLPGKDNPILNVRNRGSYVAHGALIENMLIASSQTGFEADLKIFPQGVSDLTAEIVLTPSQPKNEPLFSYIKERVTNRRSYKNVPLSEGEREVLISAASSIPGCELKLVEDKNQMQIIAQAMSVTEKVALETKELHRLFFKDIIWDDEKNKKGESGLYIKSLEVPPPVRLVFKIIKNWSAMKIFNLLGFNKMAAAGNAGIYASSAAHGAIITENNDENFISAGRAFQRVWLESSRLGLAFQPVAGTAFLAQKVESRDGNIFSEKNSEFIREAANKMDFAFSVDAGKVAAITFRIGRAEPPTARSYRHRPEIIFR
ncbi:MAG: hypothetical protein A2931_00760 [Candidatus Niyogibacteria bacterium RIFCSPLOWO2_01_FULL_45_48]|uniref:Uncharacterized protein n=2 Tax=Candidatus Niyogiibacteriota TaxID=1817912 RepID=A0A1G2F1X2_9BACT|nr:MAG: hypothetical protein A2835_02225 [Candidatus Niyogibacteria bacterium RIFCSPHIGHO2_01_FULL_45_28]OGZ29809.1 MAG: hypothetical protein A2931_00760 [Candidatus Niyogibacteria bacterium RIFCSPLOWO2_01_FULL_45_48]OGZ31650.1 MAG: hypothetical protein A3J00_00370 [Candidatus Niyogibacteria bacterium RIFCSPLOWO2_02_FULL_45_13]